MSDQYDGHNASGTAMNLLKAVGGYARPSGRGWFMFRALTVGSSTAAIVGLTFAVIAGVLTGAGALGFVVGSCLGFCGGTLHYFHIARAEAFMALRRYPKLMQHHLEVNFPSLGYEELDAERRAKDGTLLSWFQGEGERKREGITLSGVGLSRRMKMLARQGQLVSSYQTATEALVEIENRNEQRIVERILSREAEESSG